MFNSRTLDFNSTQKITCPASTPNLDGSKPFTIAGTCKLTDPAGWGGIVQKCTSGDEGFELVANSRFLRLYMKNGSEVLDCEMTAAYLSEEFNFWAVTFDPSTQTAKMYVNGAEVAVTLSSTLTGPLANTALPMVIGEGFKGLLGSLQMYQRVLDSTEVAALSSGTNSSTPVDPQTLDTSDDLIFQLDLGPKPDNKLTMHDTAGQTIGSVEGDIAFGPGAP